MVEFRYVWGSEPAPEFGENICRRVKVLQYREAMLYVAENGEFRIGKAADGNIAMSPWQDIPTAD
jgi:hypothetical protein